MNLRRFLWLALFLIGAGYFGPWVWHKAAGLNLSADDMGEWIKFLPAWKAGQLPVMRELFYLPIWLTSMGLGLMAGRIKAWPGKIAVLAVAVILVLTPLPKYPELLSAFREPEFMLTFWTTVTALLLTVIGAFFGARLPDRVEAVLWIMIGLSVALFAPWMFGRAMPDIDRLYHYSIGWGIVAVVSGGLLMAGMGGVLLLRKNVGARLPRPYTD